MIAVMAVVALTASAQSNSCQEVGTFGVKPFVGLSMANTNGQYKDGSSTKNRYGFVAGVEGQYMCNEWFAFSIGAAYSQQGFKVDENNTTFKFDYVNIPVMANFYVVQGLAVKVGVQPGYMVSERGSSDNVKDSSLDGYLDVKKFDLAIPVGLSYEVANIVFDARYNVGALSWCKTGESLRNGVFQFTVGYRF